MSGPSRNRFITGLTWMLAVSAYPAVAAEYDPQAVLLLRDAATAYRSLPAYSDQGGLTFKEPPNDQLRSRPCEIAFAPPNQLRFSLHPSIPLFRNLISDGTNLTLVFNEARPGSVLTFVSDVLPRPTNLEAIRGTQAWSALVASDRVSPAEPLLSILLALFLDADPVSTILSPFHSARAEADRELGAGRVKSVLLVRNQGPDLRLLIDPDTKMLRRIESLATAERPDEHKSSTPHRETVIGWWESERTKTRPLPDELFRFTPGPNDDKCIFDGGDIWSLKKLALSLDHEAALRSEIVGRPAPDFVLSVAEARGRTKKIRKADLVGKVVLMDFWATWCGPCLQELPHIQALVEAYKERDDVAIIAVSQDSEPAEADGVRKLIETTLAKRGLSLADRRNVMMALDPSKGVGDQFGVKGLPTLIILDGAGVVRAFHYGYIPSGVRKALGKEADYTKTLRDEIEALRNAHDAHRNTQVP